MNIEYQIGNCLDLLPSIEDKSVNLILTDLPYGTTACKWDSIIDLDKLWPEYKRIITDNGAIILTATMGFAIQLINSNPDMFRYDLIWHKTKPVGFLHANKMPLRNHEMILVFYNKLPTFNPQYTQGKVYNRKSKATSPIYNNNPDYIQNVVNKETRNPLSVIKFKNHNNNNIHHTQKPLALWEYLIRQYTNPGDMVHDSCLGSGTTLEACRNTNRSCIVFELSDEWENNYKRIIRESAPEMNLLKKYGLI